MKSTNTKRLLLFTFFVAFLLFIGFAFFGNWLQVGKRKSRCVHHDPLHQYIGPDGHYLHQTNEEDAFT